MEIGQALMNIRQVVEAFQGAWQQHLVLQQSLRRIEEECQAAQDGGANAGLKAIEPKEEDGAEPT